jgi:pimeloyl-ACP methyl ester carboxylesterase
LSPSASHLERFEHGGGTLVDEASGGYGPQGPHFVFLHGWGGSRESLRGIGVLFQHTARVHLIDLPGFGDAPPPPDHWSTLEYTDLVQQYFLQRLQGDIVLVGHSFGSRVSLRIGARRLTQVRAIVLMAAPGLPLQGWSWQRIRRTGIRMLRRLFVALPPVAGRGLLEWHTSRFGSKDYLAAGGLRLLLVRTVNENLTESARSVACPVLLIYGTDDRETPVWLAQRYRELMNGRATLKLLLHKDHHLYTGTGAHLCALKIRQWLEGLGLVGLVGQVESASALRATAGQAGEPASRPGSFGPGGADRER